MTNRFFPYHPLRIRLAFLAAGALCAFISGWAIFNATRGSESAALPRAGISLGLMLAFFYVVFRLRPKKGWGVEVEPLRVVISHPFEDDEPTRLLWTEVSQVLRGGKRRNHLLLFLETGGRLIIPAHRFARKEDFEALYAFAIEKVPPPRLDA